MAINVLPVVMNLLANKSPKAGALMGMFNSARTSQKRENNEVRLSVYKKGDKAIAIEYGGKKIPIKPSVY